MFIPVWIMTKGKPAQFAITWMKPEGTVLSEISQTKKDREFPGGPVVRTPSSHCRGPGLGN